MRRSLALLVVLALAGCGGSSPSSRGQDVCTPQAEKAATRDLMRSWYLYQDHLADVDPSDPAYPDLQSYLNALTKPARDLTPSQDRGWTYATTLSQSQSFFQDGQTVGFGLGLLERGTQELISQVFPGSAAFGAGFRRGDEILAIGDTPTSLVDVPTLISTNALGAAFGPATAGVTRSFQVRQVTDGATVVRTMTKAAYGLDPVPAPTVIRQAGLPPVGYVALRTFIQPAEALLTTAFQQLKAAGVQYVVVDLRYNGGGLVQTAEVLANLLGGGLSGTMYGAQFNAQQATRNDTTVAWAPVAQSIAPLRVAFITTGASASASELVPNALEAYLHANLALVGAKTYGKPVGQAGFSMQQCNLAVYLISFRLVNAEGDGSYYEGLPDAPQSGPPKFSGSLCAAADDLSLPPGDANEASTKAALSWLATGTCPPAPAAAAPGVAALKAAPAPDRYPEAPQPDFAQRHVRGLF